MAKRNSSEYKNPLSTKLLALFAALDLIAGIFLLFIGLTSGKGAEGFVNVYIGIGCLFSSALLFVVADMSSNLHFMEQNLQTMLDTNHEYQTMVIQLLQNVISQEKTYSSISDEE